MQIDINSKARMLDYEYLVMDEDGNGDRGVEKWNAN